MKQHLRQKITGRLLASLLVILSILCLRLPWIYSTVLAAYGGIFNDATEVTGTVSSIVSSIAGIDLSSTDRALDEVSNGAIGPFSLYRTTGDLRDTVVRLRGIEDRFDLSEILEDPRLGTLFAVFAVYRFIIWAVLLLGGVQIVWYWIRGVRTKAPFLFAGQAVLAGLFIGAWIVLGRSAGDLKLLLTPFPFLALILSIPSDFLISVWHAWRRHRKRVKERIAGKEPGAVKRFVRRALGIVLIVALGFGADIYYAYVYTHYHEMPSDALETNTDPVYSDEAFKKVLASYGYGASLDLDRMVANSYVIPGLKTTLTLENGGHLATCTSMTPQGVCIADNYLLVSAYCASGKHNSVIYVIGRYSHEFIKEIVLPGRPHVGGIAYDPEHEMIWVCDYSQRSSSAYVDGFTMQELKNYAARKQKRAITYKYRNAISSQKRASFLDYDNGRLYIGNFKNNLSGLTTVQAFRIDKETGDLVSTGNSISNLLGLDGNILVPSTITVINGGVQGFTTDSQVTAISVSWGPFDSRLLEYMNTGGINDYFRFSDAPDRSYTLPPMLEQITAESGKLYLCFESAAYAYRSRFNQKVDRIIVLDF